MKRGKLSKKEDNLLLLIQNPLDSRASYRTVLYSYTTYRMAKDDSYRTVSEFLIFPFNFLN